MSCFFKTWTGKTVDLEDPKPDMIDVVDLAHALANICRYNGHCLRYSVAEHSVLMSRVFSSISNPGRLPLLALLHDAAEAYLGDIISPWKNKTPQYSQEEARWMLVILEALSIEPPTDQECALLADADRRIVIDEMAAVSRYPAEDTGILPLGVRIYRWGPDRAKEEFLNRYEEVKNDDRK